MVLQETGMETKRGEVRDLSSRLPSWMSSLPKRNDVDMKDKDPVFQQPTPGRSQRCVEDEMNICAVPENENEKAGSMKSGKAGSMMMMTTKRRSVVMYVPTCALVLCLVCTMAEAAGFPVLETNQNLPSLCTAKLKEKGECPDKVMKAWQELNRECCDLSKGEVLHCQEPEINGTTSVLLACLQNRTVPPGKIGLLRINSSGFPELDVTTDCQPGTYRQQSVPSSSSIRHPRCPELKKIGDPDKEEKVCDGGPTRDDRFACKEGFHTLEDCCQGHDGDFSVEYACVLLICPEGQRPDRIINGSCSDGSLRVFYLCIEGKSSREGQTSTMPPSVPPQVSSPVTPDDLTPRSSTANSTSSGGPGQKQSNPTTMWAVIGVVIVLVAIGGMILVYVLVKCWRHRNTPGYDGVSQQDSAVKLQLQGSSSSSSSSSHQW